MANFCIVTNNPKALAKYPVVTVFSQSTVEEIFIAARDRIHKGAVLINHPLSGSVKPNESPYKSLVLSLEDRAVDPQSLQLIEGAQAVLKKLQVKQHNFSQRILEDFQVIDLDLLDSAIKALPTPYHM